jgi:signal transduction histidine kinase
MDSTIGLCKELAQEALDSMRRTLAGLQTHPHAQSGLPEALEQFLAPHLSSHGMRLMVESSNWPAGLPIEWTSNLYLVVREAVSNAEKHARTSLVSAVLRADTEGLFISVTDNGIGFNANDLVSANGRERSGSGFGISCMQDRVRTLGGELVLKTAVGCGVRLEIRLPNPGKPT